MVGVKPQTANYVGIAMLNLSCAFFDSKPQAVISKSF